MRELKAGDRVFVKNWGSKFPSYSDWFVAQIQSHRKDFDIRWAIRFAYDVMGDISPECVPYKILYVENDKALITKDCDFDYPVYLIATHALRPIRRMTKAEIEKELGYEIEIIGD